MTQMKLSFFQVYHFVHYSTEIYMFSTCKNISKLEPYCVFKTYFLWYHFEEQHIEPKLNLK